MTNFNIVCILQPITKAFALTFQGIPGIEGVDTRRLTKVIRSKGTMLGRLVVADPTKHENLEHALQEASKTPIHDPAKFNLVEQVSIKVLVFQSLQPNRHILHSPPFLGVTAIRLNWF